MSGKTSPKKQAIPVNQSEAVDAFLAKLDHPLTQEIEAVRAIIKSTHKDMGERVKWNAPSFFYKEDLATFHVRPKDHVHLIFHHIAVTRIKSPLLEGDYKDRRMTYFHSMKEIKEKRAELTRIFKTLISAMNKIKS